MTSSSPINGEGSIGWISAEAAQQSRAQKSRPKAAFFYESVETDYFLAASVADLVAESTALPAASLASAAALPAASAVAPEAAETTAAVAAEAAVSTALAAAEAAAATIGAAAAEAAAAAGDSVLPQAVRAAAATMDASRSDLVIGVSSNFVRVEQLPVIVGTHTFAEPQRSKAQEYSSIRSA